MGAFDSTGTCSEKLGQADYDLLAYAALHRRDPKFMHKVYQARNRYRGNFDSRIYKQYEEALGWYLSRTPVHGQITRHEAVTLFAWLKWSTPEKIIQEVLGDSKHKGLPRILNHAFRFEYFPKPKKVFVRILRQYANLGTKQKLILSKALQRNDRALKEIKFVN